MYAHFYTPSCPVLARILSTNGGQATRLFSPVLTPHLSVGASSVLTGVLASGLRGFAG